MQRIEWSVTCFYESSWNWTIEGPGVELRELDLTAVAGPPGSWHADWSVPDSLHGCYTLTVWAGDDPEVAMAFEVCVGIELETSLAITWPEVGDPESYVLEMAEAASGPWTEVLRNPVLINGRYTVILESDKRARYYRLIKRPSGNRWSLLHQGE